MGCEQLISQVKKNYAYMRLVLNYILKLASSIKKKYSILKTSYSYCST